MQLSEFLKRFWFILFVILGILMLILLIQSRQPPQQSPVQEQIFPVRVLTVPQVTVLPQVDSYGTVKPATQWEAVAEVSGKIINIHPRLKQGEFLSEGTTLLNIDPRDYELAVAQAKANLQSNAAKLEELHIQEENTRLSLKIEQRALQLSRQELDRLKKLGRNQAVSENAIDQQERAVLGGYQSVQSLKNTLNLLPTQKQVLQAQQTIYQAQLESAELNLARTKIKLPFSARIGEVHVEKHQYIRQGTILTIAENLEMAEITAQVPLDKMRILIRSDAEYPDLIKYFTEAETMDLQQLLQLSAVIRLQAGEFQTHWLGRFTRLGNAVDPKTRTINVIVAVDKPYEKARPGIRPPLSKNMFVKVELRGQPYAEKIIIPRSALHRKQVYLVNDKNRLEKRPIKIAFTQNDFLVVKEGLQPGETLVLSDIVPAISGMQLNPIEDEQAKADLIAEALGKRKLSLENNNIFRD